MISLHNWLILNKRKLVIAEVATLLIIAGLASYYYQNNSINLASRNSIITPTPKPTVTAVPSIQPTAIAKNPPKYATSSTGIKGVTKTNLNGTKTTCVSEGNIGCPATPISSGSSSPLQIKFTDQTGQYASLKSPLLSYLNSTLLHGNEVSALSEIIIQNAGATGWTGLYSGSYTTNTQGKIISAYGWITLNVYYYQSSPQFVDYMKLVLSHEYGHHYTLYHKWVDWNLPSGVRFPDSYYAVRPLSKTTTAIDYSLGWGNCESEIIAEDYSYLFSGYGYDAMSATYGYPSAATKTWLINFPNGPGGSTTDNPPTVSITSPSNGATLSGTVTFSATAGDDIAVAKVGFYVDNNLINEDTSAPYQTSFSTAAYANGSHTLKAVAYDASHNTPATITVTFSNAVTDSEDPVVTINLPTTDPYNWTSGDLTLRASATDNIAVTKMEFYVDGSLALTYNGTPITGLWQSSGTPAGTYIVTAKAYDAAGNVGQASITIIKS